MAGIEENAEEVFLTIKEARNYLGTSKPKMACLVKEQELPVYEDLLDKRVKLVRLADLNRIRERRLNMSRNAPRR